MIPQERRSLSVWQLLKLVNVGYGAFLPSAFFSVVSAFLNLILLRLYFPLITGIVHWNFTSVLDLPVIGAMLKSAKVSPDDSGTLLIAAAVSIYLATISKSIFTYLSSMLMFKEAAGASTRLRTLCYLRALRFGKLYFDRSNISRLNANIIQSARWINAQFAALQGLFAESLLLLGYLVAMAAASWKLTCVSLVVVPVLQIATRKSVGRIRTAAKRHEHTLSDLHARTMQTLFGITLVQGSGQMTKELAHLQELGAEEVEGYFQVQKQKAFTLPIQEASGATIQLLVSCALGYFAQRTYQPSGDLIIFFFLATKSVPLAGTMLRFHSTLAENSGVMVQLTTLLDDDSKHIVPEGLKELGELREGITVRNLSFAYTQARPILSHLHCDFPAKTINAIIGATGSGKSTLASLLMRFYDCPPETIFLDGTDIRQFSLDSLRQQISYAGQDPIIFEDTLRNNVTYGLTSLPTERSILEIFEKCRLGPLLNRLSGGLDSVVGERGSQLSGGEKQRVALIRALLRPTSILILDEATSALDAVTEHAVLETIKSFSANKTVLIISHRDLTIGIAQQLVNLDFEAA